jgi:hypothetical protein
MYDILAAGAAHSQGCTSPPLDFRVLLFECGTEELCPSGLSLLVSCPRPSCVSFSPARTHTCSPKPFSNPLTRLPVQRTIVAVNSCSPPLLSPQVSAEDSGRLCDVHDRISEVMDSLRSVANVDVSVRFLPGAGPRSLLDPTDDDDDADDVEAEHDTDTGHAAGQGKAYGPVWRVVRVQGVLWKSGFVARSLCPLLRQYWRYMRPRVISLVRDAAPSVATGCSEPEGGGGQQPAKAMVEVWCSTHSPR